MLGWTKSFPVTIGQPEPPGSSRTASRRRSCCRWIVVFGNDWGVTGAGGAVLASSVAFALAWLVLLLRLTAGRLRPVEPAPA